MKQFSWGLARTSRSFSRIDLEKRHVKKPNRRLKTADHSLEDTMEEERVVANPLLIAWSGNGLTDS